MKKLLLSLALLAAATAAAAQDVRPTGLLGRRAAGQVRSEQPRPAARPLAPPACYCPAARSVDVVRVVADAVATVQLGRAAWAYGTTYGTDEQPAAPARYRRPARPASASAAARIGLKAGLNIATITGVSDADVTAVAGLSGGLMADVGLGEHLSFHPELLYSQKGAKGTQTDPLGLGINISSREHLHYLDLPLLLRAKASGFFAEAGPQLGYLVARKSVSTLSAPSMDPETDTDTSFDNVRRLDVGYVLGLGYALPQGLELGLRYNGGFSDLQKPSADPKLRNSVFQVQAGYLF